MSLRARCATGGIAVEVHDGGSRACSRTCSPGVGEPFFTTKAPGEGRGLGALHRAHAGGATGRRLAGACESSPGQGTTARLTLPGTEPRRQETGTCATSCTACGRGRCSSWTTIEVLRERLGRAFRERGWDVTTAGSYDAAIAAAPPDARSSPSWTCACPGLRNGVLERCSPSTPPRAVVMLTGYGFIATAVDAIRLGAVGYLSKPADVTRWSRPTRAPPGMPPSQLELGARPRARRVGAHPARAHRLWRQRLGDRSAARHPPTRHSSASSRSTRPTGRAAGPRYPDLSVPELLELLVALGEVGLVAEEDWHRVADPTCVGAFETLHDPLASRKGKVKAISSSAAMPKIRSP